MRMILNFISESRTTRVIPVLLALALLAPACDGRGADGDRLQIIATTSIVGDVVGEIVGDNATVETVIGPGIDPHDFQASARQVEAISGADLVVAIGLGLEESLIDVIDAQANEVLYLAPELEPIPFVGPDDVDDADHEDDDHEDGLDPHIWQDPSRMAAAVALIVDKLDQIEPDIDWEAQASSYRDRLESLDQEISTILASIPAERRRLVTSHEALGYFADRYDFEIVGVIVTGGSTLSEPSAADLAALADAIEASGVSAIFTDAYNPTTLAAAVASEVGEQVQVVPLVTDALTDDAPTYVEMMLLNADSIARALGSQ